MENYLIQTDLFESIEVMVNDRNLGIKFFDKALIDEYWDKWQTKLLDWKKFSRTKYNFILSDYYWWRSRFNDDFPQMPANDLSIFKAIWKLNKNKIVSE